MPGSRPGMTGSGWKLGAYVIRRFFLMLLTLFGISVIIFVLLRVMPGNIVDVLYDAAGYVNPREKAKIEAELGLDKPLAVQYATWIGGLAHGDLGYSFVSDRPAVDEILPRIPVTAKLAALALSFAVLIGVPLGVLSAVRQNTGMDYVLRVLSLSGLSLPSFPGRSRVRQGDTGIHKIRFVLAEHCGCVFGD